MVLPSVKKKKLIGAVNVHVGSSAEDYEDQQRLYDFGVKNTLEKRSLEVYTDMTTTVMNTLGKEEIT